MGSIPTAPTKFPLVVKWYNSRLITGHYKFDSCREDQNKLGVLSISVDGDPWKIEAAGSNPATQTKFYSVKSKQGART